MKKDFDLLAHGGSVVLITGLSKKLFFTGLDSEAKWGFLGFKRPTSTSKRAFFLLQRSRKKGKKGPVRLPAITWRCAHVAHIFNIPARNHFFLSSCCCFCCLNFFCAGANWIWITRCLLRFQILLMPLAVVMTRALKHFTGHNDVSVIRKPLSFITIYQVDPGGIRNKVLRIEGRLWHSDHATREWWLHMFFNQENNKPTLPSLEKNYLYDWL